ncbi:uncharacterized protein EV422DRAFT_284547 [Fimicolochytrium jonesii]|uniref:uncharacterized protein n=1 Tax=Fimicolochytrium jonesii TaxID=1396493 RepID=UPI0022FE875F|nr:uncharacterized protein EV422DRAFT_284547 [Fimicolochytrium jonesii]KAI8816477.1 hypothetical protein EV422DRAFT_284547 [Fimicolochytrium jonesii]
MFPRPIWVALTLVASALHCRAEAPVYFYPPLSDATTREIDWTSASSVVSEVVGIAQGFSQILPGDESPLLGNVVKEVRGGVFGLHGGTVRVSFCRNR